MPYLHEQRLAQARKMLYMLGSNPKKQRNYQKDLESMAAIPASMAEAQRNDLKRRQAAAAAANLKEAGENKAAREETEDVSGMNDADYKQYLDDVSIISGNGPRKEVAMPAGVSWDSAGTMEQAKERLKVNAAAASAPLGGSFTRSGLKEASDKSDALTDDFHTADNLMLQGSYENKVADADVANGTAVPSPRMYGAVQPMMSPGMMGTNRVYRGGF